MKNAEFFFCIWGARVIQNFVPFLPIFFVLWLSEDIKESDGPFVHTKIIVFPSFDGSMDIEKVTDAMWEGTDPHGDQETSGFCC